MSPASYRAAPPRVGVSSPYRADTGRCQMSGGTSSESFPCPLSGRPPRHGHLGAPLTLEPRSGHVSRPERTTRQPGEGDARAVGGVGGEAAGAETLARTVSDGVEPAADGRGLADALGTGVGAGLAIPRRRLSAFDRSVWAWP
ncbi:hypothetical protein FAGKG844_40135 [Frankia sp. AgKG'84/4]